MEVSITTISRNGQIVIPSAIRKALCLAKSEKFLVISEGDTIVLKRLRKERLRKELDSIFASLSDDFAKAGLEPEDAEKEIVAHRTVKRRSHETSG
jgi:AbrB family looped-hinge helix DNA binding protein